MDAKDNNGGQVDGIKRNWEMELDEVETINLLLLERQISVPARDSYMVTGKLSRGNELSDGPMDRS